MQGVVSQLQEMNLKTLTNEGLYEQHALALDLLHAAIDTYSVKLVHHFVDQLNRIEAEQARRAQISFIAEVYESMRQTGGR